MIKGIAMAQWVNRLQNNIFVNAPSLPLLCATGSYGRLAGWLASWLADEI